MSHGLPSGKSAHRCNSIGSTNEASTAAITRAVTPTSTNTIRIGITVQAISIWLLP